ncbi:MAG: bifunctional phosphoribosyl-AMP cyclohydrolase/phosphoribosyl-ATP diphosphatase HisIE [Gammaproteobacteria bacterium]|nr:bifunctional phosphoribosyl-AMP cyclohydrolase/phosphoribosyl-ATP diphosphatase HisIE [Gammaproteobacteria bacterium]
MKTGLLLAGADGIESLAWEKSGGLLPAIAQHAASGEVLMLGFMNREALDATLVRGRAVFWSRSREALWEKGETSGNTLDVESVTADCDADTLLLKVRPQGPTCHTGAPRCFADPELPLAFLAELDGVITARKSASADSSYTASLFAEGLQRMAQKVGEEGVETALAANGETHELLDESADLLFHLMVLLQARDLDLAAVAARLRERHKANRGG